MDKTLPTIVGAPDTIDFAAMNMAFNVARMLCIKQTILSIPATKARAKKKILLIWETIFPIAGTMVSDTETMVFVSDTNVSLSKTIVGNTQAMF